MNIQQAKEQIKNSIKLYLKKDEYGDYRVPVVRQRPVFLLGSPGIGKTAIMEQIAGELGIALVSYSMTHHTRQSALGLPYISKKNYEGMEVSVSEYTMSEIIASIYEVMQESGLKEGILFLDEINCVSETLAPAMLQFLQYKVFGRHAVPEGWVIVTAGNPPEYNKSVREFDVVTMDRMKIIDVEADYNTWKNYAVKNGIHSAVITYLDMKKSDYYLVETVAGGKTYVTARGWEDLSAMIKLCEEENLTVDENLVGQYLHHERIVKEFVVYYELYNKYKNDYRIMDILEGHVAAQTKEKGRVAKFDERLSLLGMLLDHITGEINDEALESDVIKSIMNGLKAAKSKSQSDEEFVLKAFADELVQAQNRMLESKKKAGTLSSEDKIKIKKVTEFWQELAKKITLSDSNEGFDIAKEMYEARVGGVLEDRKRINSHLHNLFVFVEESFRDGNEMVVLLTELTVRENCAHYIAQNGCEDYSRLNKEMMLNDRRQEILNEINNESNL